MKTLRLAVNPTRMDSDESDAAIARAAEMLRGGGLVALPTETVYGLGANAFDPVAVEKIFAAKQRPSWDPIIVHIAGPVTANPMLESLTIGISGVVRELMGAFWPGPLTLLLPRSQAVPDIVTAGRPLVGVRMPAHPVSYEIIRRAGVPVAAPSANRFGHISPTTAAHVLEDLDGKIDAVVDAGPTLHGVESTVLDPTKSPMLIYRPGAITAAQIHEVGGAVEHFSQEVQPAAPREGLPSPGVGLRHYAPRARLVLVEAPQDSIAGLSDRMTAAALPHARQRIGIMLPAELANSSFEPPLRGALEFAWGRWSAPAELAEKLYSGLRALDSQGCDVILCPLPGNAGRDDTGMIEAIRDRLRKAGFTG